MMIEDGELLAREARHRVANELAMAAGALRLAERGALSPEAMSSAVARLEVASAVNAVLCREPDAGDVDLAVSLGTLRPAIALLAETAGWGVALDAAGVRVDGVAAARIALIVYELVANAIRHADPVGARRIEVVVDLVDGALRLSVRDGGRAHAWARPGGQGSRIVDALVGAMGGTVSRGGGAARGGVEVVLPARRPTLIAATPAPWRATSCTYAPAREGVGR